jgi:hypothetical protein
MSLWADLVEEHAIETKKGVERVEAYTDWIREPRVKTNAVEATLAFWARTAHEEVVKLCEGRDKHYGVMGVVKVNRPPPKYSNHVHAFKFDFLMSTYNRTLPHGPAWTSGLARELVSRYFVRDDERSQASLVSAVVKAINEFIEEIERMETRLNSAGSLNFLSRTITRPSDFWSISCDIVVAIGLRLSEGLGGQSFDTRRALSRACRTIVVGGMFQDNMNVPMYLHIGGECHQLETKPLGFNLEWTTPTSYEPTVVQGRFPGCSIISSPIAYNAGVQRECYDYVPGAQYFSRWITIVLPLGAFLSNVDKVWLDENQTIHSRPFCTLDDAFKSAQNAGWADECPMANVKVDIDGVSWECTANNMIVNDVGTGSYRTYGQSNAVTIRLYARTGLAKLAPPVPSIHVMSNDRREPFIVTLAINGKTVKYPLILNCVAMNSIPVLHTILVKNTSHGIGALAGKRNSSVSLSSAFGLQTPREIGGAISTILDSMTMLREVFEILVGDTEKARSVEQEVMTESRFGSSSGEISAYLGGTRGQVLNFLREDDNLTLAYAYALSLVQSGIVLCWLVFYIRAGICPVYYNVSPDPAPSDGVHSLEFIVRTTLMNWAVVLESGLPTSIQVIREMLSTRGSLYRCLTFCKDNMFT